MSILGLVPLGWAAPDPSTSVPLRVDFDAPIGCSGTEAFYERVRARTDRVRLAAPGEAALHLQLRVTRRGAKVHGELRGISERGETDVHSVDGGSCEEVVEALSLTAALALDPNARLLVPDSPSSSSASSTPSSTSSVASSPSSAAAAPEAPESGATANVSPKARASRGRAPPNQTPGGNRAVDLILGVQGAVAGIVSERLNTGGGVYARVETHLDEPLSPSVGLTLRHLRNDLLQTAEKVSVGWTTLALSACPLRWSPGELVSIQPCALGVGGWMTATGQNISHPDSASRSWWSVGGLIRSAVALGGRSVIDLELGLSLPLARRRFILTEPERVVAETPSVSTLAGLGVGYTF